MKKIIWILIIFFVLYILAIFNIPIVAQNIEKKLKIEWFNDFILKLKWTYDYWLENNPDVEEWLNTYNKALSGATKIKEDVINGAQYAKDKVDSARVSLSGAQETINKAWDFIQDASEKLEQWKEIIDTVKDITESWSINQ